MADATQATDNLNLVADADGDGLGDIILKTGSTERGRITNAGVAKGALAARADISASAAGVLSEPFSSLLPASATAPTSQLVFGVLNGLRKGDVVTGVLLRNLVAAAGTAPTTARFGIANSAGTILAISGNVNAAASWPLGPCQFPLASPYTVLADGGYYACFVVNGTWGTTQPTPIRGTGSGAAGGALAGAVTPGFQWAGQTDLPAVAGALTLTAALSVGYYIGFY